MASNFSLRFLRNRTCLKLVLKGDFDGSSAHVLMNALKRNCNRFKNILVDTDGLRKIHPFGQDILTDRLPEIKRKSVEIVFTGKHKNLCTA